MLVTPDNSIPLDPRDPPELFNLELIVSSQDGLSTHFSLMTHGSSAFALEEVSGSKCYSLLRKLAKELGLKSITTSGQR